jgi:hypothetical protein
MNKYWIVIILAILFLGLSDIIPIEYKSGTPLIISKLTFTIIMLSLCFVNYWLIKKLSKKIRISSYIINSLLLVVYSYIFFFDLFVVISGHFPVWENNKLYISQNTDSSKVFLQKMEVSGSMYEWRFVKIKDLSSNIWYKTNVSESELNGIWKIISLDDSTTQIVELKEARIKRVISNKN